MNNLEMNDIIFHIPVIPECLMLDDKLFYTVEDIIDLFENKLKIDKVLSVKIKENIKNGKKIRYAFIHFSNKSKNGKTLYDFINNSKNKEEDRCNYEYHIDGYFNSELQKQVNFYSSKDNSPRYIVLKNCIPKTIFNSKIIENEIKFENNPINIGSDIKTDLIKNLENAYNLIIKQQKYITNLESIISKNKFI